MFRRRLPLLVAIFLLCLAPAGRAAELAGYLQAIGLDAIRRSESPFRQFRGEGMAVAVFDTGVDASLDPPHVAFGADAGSRVVGGANFVPDRPADGPRFADAHGHGTHVASVAVGRRVTLNTSAPVDIAGVAPEAEVYAVRVLDESGNGSFSGIIDGLDWVIDQVRHHGSNIRAVNMSLGTAKAFVTEPAGPVFDQFNQRARALGELGVPIIAASGNGGSSSGLAFPAISTGVISVGSLAADGAISSFSNRNDALDLLAPGEGIWGAAVGTQTFYRSGSGTSFAAPLATGAALLISEAYAATHGTYPSVRQLRQLLAAGETLGAASGLPHPRLDLEASLSEATTIPEPATIVLMLLAAAVSWPGRLRRRASS